jgi:hypothetical protein
MPVFNLNFSRMLMPPAYTALRHAPRLGLRGKPLREGSLRSGGA